MLSGYYAGVSGTYYSKQGLEVVANNMANKDTAGFRRELLMIQTRRQNEEGRFLKKSVREKSPASFGVQRAGVFKDFQETGTLKSTENPLDIAIPGEIKNGFFAVRPQGGKEDEVYYSRNGGLSIGPSDPQNAGSPLVLMASGNILLDANSQPIEIDSEKGPFSIGDDGAVYQDNEKIADLAVWSLNNQDGNLLKQGLDLQQLIPLGNSLFQIPEAMKTTIQPERLAVGQNGVSSLVKQGSSETSNVDIYRESILMMNLVKNAEANIYSLRRQLSSLKELISMARH
ncbi:MAG: flgF [Chlamydiales bacterium]|jgi:flagellar basal-body rod protein FlgG|nr:flgF [Chlamydiales bacterium]